jgi:bifunctional non-homologous end joining protein LigD
MALELYRRKRDFGVSPEPPGGTIRRRKSGLAFVIQKHRASRMHYDFRLELDGVLLSWAVPKGPSLDPAVRRLAMHVEDHPIEYGSFEGVIPPKQYGAGTVLLWDRGVWIPREDPKQGYGEGRLKFELRGEKLNGGWMLVRSRGGKYAKDGNAWFLIKERDRYARPGSESAIVDERPESVTSGRRLEEIAEDPDRVWHSNRSVEENVKHGAVRRSKRRFALGRVKGAQRGAMPDMVMPELATLVKTPPEGDEWLHELKLDGYRMLSRIESGKVRIYSRNGKEWTSRFGAIARALTRLPTQSAWLDGEVVVVQPDGRTSFQALQNALSDEGSVASLHYFVFDLLYLNGHDLRAASLLERKRLLEAVLESAPALLRMSGHIQGAGSAFFAQACALGTEGMISKRKDAPHRPGRSRNWLKVKCALRQEMVIGGYTDPEGKRQGFGALLLGVYEEDGGLRYCGKVGTGFDDESLRLLHERLKPLEIARPAFRNPPRGAEARRAHWVEPRLVAEIAFTEWTNDGTLRHPSFQGLREDKKARDVVREHAVDEHSVSGAEAPDGRSSAAARRRSRAAQAPQSARASETASEDVVAGIRITNPQKLLYPEAGINKLELALYYDAASEWILPHVRNRPLTLVRCPNGWSQTCFYQKHPAARLAPDIERITVQESKGPRVYMMANSREALVALLQMGALELHPFGSRAPRLDCPDRIIMDLDPGDGVDWQALAEAARLMRTLLEELGLRAFLKTTGGKGVHVVVPLQPRLGWVDVKRFAKGLADLVTHTFPERYIAIASKARRAGKIFIDYLRNGEGATAIAPYSVRARRNAPVAMPIEWDALDGPDLRFDCYNVRNASRHIGERGGDPWAEFFEVRQSVTKAMMRKVRAD